MSAPRHVLLNALYLAPGVSGGPETYLRGLAPALAQEFPELRLTVATTRSGAAALRADGWGEFAEVIALPCEDGERLRRQWAEQVLLRRTVRRVRPQLVHSLASVAPVLPGAPAVVTLHDVTFLLRPTFGRLTTWGMGALVAIAAHRADALICSTAAARAEICSLLRVDPGRFTVVPLGHEPTRVAEPVPAEVLSARHDLGGARVVLCVAAKRPHKNQAVLIEAMPRLGVDIVLILAGHAEPYEQQLRELARSAGVETRVRFLGYVPDAELEGLWRVAACAAFPTLGEGFGIPVLEALSRGVPLACSDIPVLREVGGELPHYFDPRDPTAAARAIDAAMDDADGAARGPAQAARFTWATAARGTHEVYERALAHAGR
jgi:glycosyltransferase involved in cell wall biosynthesis